MRRHAKDPCEEPQEMKRPEPDLPGCALEVDGLVRVRVDPERRLHCPAPVDRASLRRSPLSPGHDLDEAAGEEHSHLADGDIAPALGRRLRQLAKHHHLGQGRNGASPPDAAPASDRFGQLRSEMKGETLVADGVVMRAHVLITGMAHQDRSGHQLERLTAGPIAEAPLAHVPQWRLKNCTARSCRLAAAKVRKVPRFLRFPVRGFFLREYRRYSPEGSFRIMPPRWLR